MVKFTEEQERSLDELLAFLNDPEPGQMCLQGYAGTGKAQPVGCKVLTPSGWVKMGDISVGDAVVAADGTECAVTGVFPQGVMKVYKITFSDGRIARSSGDHLWKFWNHRKWYVMSLEDIIKYRANILRPERFAIPLCAPFMAARNVNLPIDPYLIGVLIGDGELSNNSVNLSLPDEFIRDEVRRLIPDDHHLVPVHHSESNIDFRISCYGGTGPNHRNLYGLRYMIEVIGLNVMSHMKFIPDRYKSGSLEQKLSLLQGLFDTDGTVDKRTGTPSFTSTSLKLAKDVQELLWSIGAEAYMSSKIPYYTHNGERREGRLAYTVFVRIPDRGQLFRLPRKKDLASGPNQYAHRLKLKITDIQEDGEDECKCIAISHPERLYITDDYVVTHNTTTIQELVRRYKPGRYRHRRDGDQGLVLTAPTNKATNVLKLKNVDAGLNTPCTTIHKLLGVRPSSESERRELKKAGKDGSSAYDVVVVDECSMVSSELMALIQRALRFHKVIYVGDPMQLPPIGEELSDTFQVRRKTILSTVMRQRDENPIIALTADLRSQIASGRADLGVFAPAQGSDGCGVFVADGNLHDWLMDAFLSEAFCADNDLFRYLAWTNAAVGSVNRLVRAAKYGAKAPEYVPGERLLFRRPAIKYVRSMNEYGEMVSRPAVLFNTDEESDVISAEEGVFDPKEFFKEHFRQSGSAVAWMPMIPCWYLSMKGESDEFPITVMVPHIKGRAAYDRMESIMKDNARANRGEWPLYFAFIESFSETQPVYALTVHRSQGSTFGTVFVDLLDIRKNRNTTEMLKLLYVAASRPKQYLVV